MDMNGKNDMDVFVDKDRDSDMDRRVNAESLKEACGECGGHRELDTSQGDFTTIAVGILLALVVYSVVPGMLGIRLGNFPKVFVYGGFLILVVVFWTVAEKVKEYLKNRER